MERYQHLKIEEEKEQQDKVSTEDSTEAPIDAYLKLERARHSARKKISAYYNRKQWLDCFRRWAVVNVPRGSMSGI